MPNAERAFADENAFDPFARAQLAHRNWPAFERRASSNRAVMETLQSLEFNSADWHNEPPTKEAAEKALDAVLAGGDIQTSVQAFFNLLRTNFCQPEASAYKRPIGYPDDLWKRDAFFGAVTPLHSTSVAVAIRKRPDLVTTMVDWYLMFDALHNDQFPDGDMPSDINEAADGIIHDVVKFSAFKESKLVSMTVMVGQHMYQIRKFGHREIDVFEKNRNANTRSGRQRRFYCTPHRLVLGNLDEGRNLSASLLIQGNRVLAMGTDDTTTINQIFKRENLGNLSMVEHIFLTEAPNTVTGTEKRPDVDTVTDGFDFDNFDFCMPEKDETYPHSTKHFQLTEKFFEIIAEAVGEACKGTRAIFTARVLITDTNVRIFAYDGDLVRHHHEDEAFMIPPRLDESLLKNLKFPDFEQEIADIEELAKEALEHKIFSGCLEHLEFDEADLIDPVKAKMVEILVRTVKIRHQESHPEHNYQALWREIEAAEMDGLLYMDAVKTRHEEGKSSLTKLPGNGK